MLRLASSQRSTPQYWALLAENRLATPAAREQRRQLGRHRRSPQCLEMCQLPLPLKACLRDCRAWTSWMCGIWQASAATGSRPASLPRPAQEPIHGKEMRRER